MPVCLFLKMEAGFASETLVTSTRQNDVNMGIITCEIMIRYVLLIYMTLFINDLTNCVELKGFLMCFAPTLSENLST
jgi:hypothetical protein